MAFGKEARIITLLVIDVAFFLLEIIVGYAVGSLALVADSFHMLNDVMSLIVALYAVRLVNQGNEKRDPRYSYGWQRAEILGALINGVFLLALCFSIFMEAIERFVNVTEVQNPKLVVIVGSLGLASNIVGLFLFHDHGHSHGGHSHGHSHGTEGHSHSHGAEDGHSHSHEEPQQLPSSSPIGKRRTHDRERSESVSSLLGHPAATRAYVVRTAHDLGYDANAAGPSSHDTHEREALLNNKKQQSKNYGSSNGSHDHSENGISHDDDLEDGDGMRLRHGHSHGGGEGSMNMQGVFLHVLGDALGNVGVIAAGLFIALSSAWWRYYTDPAISFLITIIIFTSALPLVKSASFILLQGVPSAVPLDEVHSSLLEVKGVLSVHELHIWQLSESKNVASVHVLIDVDEANLTDQAATSAAKHRYMEIAQQIRNKLHKFNIHSSTIQPEFVRGGMRGVARAHGVEIDEHVTNAIGKLVSKQGELVERTISKNGSSACLIACGPDGNCVESACCPPISANEDAPKSASKAPSTYEHSHDHDHA
ncbi:cation efflux protein [Meira miltonrushii]|uniref:Cation efflux protein n=1 Tax=Meira miltonrushii TaxID=1280837 RepID=A0A316V7P5_9BASI|nr:cation efflux protein [Meira miltonrushii]PWN33048.1 cation efflux protein [Meira miltonrushii]